MKGFITLACFCICAIRFEPVKTMPALAHGHHRQGGPLDSVVHCDDERRRHITGQLEQTFGKELASSSLTLPPAQTVVHVFLTVTYNVFNTKITEFALESAELTSEGDVPAWKISRASVKVEGEYKYSHTFSSDSGTYVLTMDHVKMYMIGNKCQVDLGQPNKRFSGSTANWGYNTYIKGTSKDDDNRDLKEKLCHFVRKVFHEVLAKVSCHPKTTTTSTTTPSIDLVPTEMSKPSDEGQNHEKVQKLDNGGEDREEEGEEKDDEESKKEEPVPHKPDHVPSSTPSHVAKSTTSSPRRGKSESKYDDYSFDSLPNDEPLVIPGYLPFVDLDEERKERQSKISPNSASTLSNLAVNLSLSAFLTIYLVTRCTFSRS